MTKCDCCEKTIQRNQASITCWACIGSFHQKCSGLIASSSTWLCINCLGFALPFYKCSDAEMLDDTLDFSASLDPGLDIHPFCSNSGQLKIMHLNTQSMVSTFNELNVNSFPLDIVALSEISPTNMAQTCARHGSVEMVLFLLLQLLCCLLLGPGPLGREYNDLNSETEQMRPVCMFLISSIAANRRHLVNRCHIIILNNNIPTAYPGIFVDASKIQKCFFSPLIRWLARYFSVLYAQVCESLPPFQEFFSLWKKR